MIVLGMIHLREHSKCQALTNFHGDVKMGSGQKAGWPEALRPTIYVVDVVVDSIGIHPLLNDFSRTHGVGAYIQYMIYHTVHALSRRKHSAVCRLKENEMMSHLVFATQEYNGCCSAQSSEHGLTWVCFKACMTQDLCSNGKQLLPHLFTYSL